MPKILKEKIVKLITTLTKTWTGTLKVPAMRNDTTPRTKYELENHKQENLLFAGVS